MTQPPDISGKVALVTGSSRGIGRAIAQRLAAAGATVVVTARSLSQPAAGQRGGASVTVPGTLEETVALIEQAGGRAFALAADLEDEGQCKALVSRAADVAGGRIDIVVNNAGFVDFQPMADMPLDSFDRTLGHYLRTPFILSQAAIPYMRRAGAGWIVNISSQDSLPPIRPYPDFEKHRGYVVYAAAKAALNRMTQGLAAELEPDNIAVNAVGPSTAIRTPGADAMIPAEFPTEDVEYLAETVLAMSYLPAAERTGLIGFSMHFPWHHGIEVRSLDGKTLFPRRAPPPWSHPAIGASGE
ncbi:SDR family NAD(P)-dependent oxidoreductase [Sphingobium sp. CAP-1]|uniref:SDR family NAD(P)-dependent oxidoreductase n=1 Tax=Sphingobium sp. CAP-1 TaxID=2676077 RepID=UPI0012BB2C27|nr:SDR family NAD(P)-dependent oxidoreductase [Sphingobium sp. CAP-1]QGP78062.1 SDR family NAD(P)-dependent oxidoreductase [Sphingobium sp. CAP-1]